MLNFGIIGHGFMGQTHTQTIKKLDYATLIAVCDINKDQLKEVNEGVKTFLKADQLLAEKDIDTVIIAESSSFRDGEKSGCSQKGYYFGKTSGDEWHRISRNDGNH